jgi:hypothetical protein
MSRTIHGKSHEALKAFRKESAALPVYWIYVSRMNNEGVTWPSVSRIAKDTGWNKNTCLKARNYLVSIQALERVSDYIRPDWRSLEPQALARKRNFDKSEYYRPTGYVMVNGKRLPMLYNGADEATSLEEKTSDVLQNTTSSETGHQALVDVNNCGTVLDSLSVLGSEDIVPATQGAPKRPIFDAIALGSWGIQDSSAVNGNGGRIGKLEAWVKKTYPGATEKTIDAFYKWWKRSNPKASAPRDLDKFSDNFIAFHQAMTAKQAAESVPAPEPEPVITEADRAESLAILRAARGKVSA